MKNKIFNLIIIFYIFYLLYKIIQIIKEPFNNIPTVTFIIPTIGRETLKNTLQSLKNQTHTNWKAIVIFDGIKPNIEENDPRINIIQIEKKGRLNYAGRVRNIGILEVNTEWVAFVDDDDTITENYLEIFENEVDVDLDVIIFRMLRGYEILPPLEHLDFVKNFVGISFCVKTRLFKNEYLWFNESATEDYDLLDLFRSKGKKIKLSKKITYLVNV